MGRFTKSHPTFRNQALEDSAEQRQAITQDPKVEPAWVLVGDFRTFTMATLEVMAPGGSTMMQIRFRLTAILRLPRWSEVPAGQETLSFVLMLLTLSIETRAVAQVEAQSFLLLLELSLFPGKSKRTEERARIGITKLEEGAEGASV